MDNTTQKEKIYINFENNEKYYQVKLLSIENKEITISKNKPLKNILEQYKQCDINFYLSDYFLKDIVYNTLYTNNDFILLQENDNFILYDLKNNIYHDFILINIINNIEDLELFITLKLQDYNINYNNDIINNIIVNFENMNK